MNNFKYFYTKTIVVETNIKNDYKIFVDLDGVLCDFEGRLNTFFGVNNPDKLDNWYDQVAKVGKRFWSDMEWNKDGKRLWDYIKKYKPTILSSPIKDPECIKGKMEWVINNLNIDDEKRIIIKSKKEQFADDKYILIDDMPKNTVSWERNGGISILHTTTSNSINKLKKLGL